MNPLRAYRNYRWRKRVEWFSEQARKARKAREWRDSPWNVRNWKQDLIRKEHHGVILVRDWAPPEDRKGTS